MVSIKLRLALLVAFSAAVSSKDVIDQLVVATSDCYQCGMTFFGTISIKVRKIREWLLEHLLMTSQKFDK
jgi:hypothetical protein